MKTTCSERKHKPKGTGRQIQAEFSKGNEPRTRPLVESVGEEAWCLRCGAHLIIHDSRLGYPTEATELEAIHD